MRMTLTLLFITAAVLWLHDAAAIENNFPQSFEQYCKAYSKSYATIEEALSREALFNNSLTIVLEHNARYARGQESWFAAINEFSDWTPAELRRLKMSNKRMAWPSEMPTRVFSKQQRMANPPAKSWIKQQSEVW